MKLEAEENIKKMEDQAKEIVREATKKEMQASISKAIASQNGKSSLEISHQVVLMV